jgi:hypothetical protein
MKGSKGKDPCSKVGMYYNAACMSCASEITDPCRSRHEFKRALRVKPAEAFEHHMCPESHCSCVFKDLPRAEWKQHADDLCSACNVGRRFKHKAGHPEASKRCEQQAFCNRHMQLACLA